MMISSILLIKKDDIMQIFEILFTFVAILCFIGVIFHLLKMVNIFTPDPILQVTSDDRVWNVYFPNVYESIGRYGEKNNRFASIFDEPGYLGTILAFYLITENYDMTKYKNLIIGVAGIFTLSFAFYLISIIYFIVSPLYSIKQKINSIIIVSIIVLILISTYPTFFEHLLWRFSYEPGFGFVGDNRGGFVAAEDSWSFLIRQNIWNLLFGNGCDAYLSVSIFSIENSTIWRLVHQVGLLFLTYFIIITLIFTQKKILNIIFWGIFIISLYQRPQVFEPIFILIMAVGCFYKTKSMATKNAWCPPLTTGRRPRYIKPEMQGII